MSLGDLMLLEAFLAAFSLSAAARDLGVKVNLVLPRLGLLDPVGSSMVTDFSAECDCRILAPGIRIFTESYLKAETSDVPVFGFRRSLYASSTEF